MPSVDDYLPLVENDPFLKSWRVSADLGMGFGATTAILTWLGVGAAYLQRYASSQSEGRQRAMVGDVETGRTTPGIAGSSNPSPPANSRARSYRPGLPTIEEEATPESGSQPSSPRLQATPEEVSRTWKQFATANAFSSLCALNASCFAGNAIVGGVRAKDAFDQQANDALKTSLIAGTLAAAATITVNLSKIERINKLIEHIRLKSVVSWMSVFESPGYLVTFLALAKSVSDDDEFPKRAKAIEVIAGIMAALFLLKMGQKTVTRCFKGISANPIVALASPEEHPRIRRGTSVMFHMDQIADGLIGMLLFILVGQAYRQA